MLDNSVPSGELSLFVEMVMRDKAFSFYRRDVAKLLVIMYKTLKGSPQRPWYKERNDKLGNFSLYLSVKMSHDKRAFVVDSIPMWLNMLAGRYDLPGRRNEKEKIAVFLRLAREVSAALKKFGPDSSPTTPPPPMAI